MPRLSMGGVELEPRIVPANTPPELVRDLNTAAGSLSPSNLFALDSTLYFVGNDGVRGNELWKTDGTATGTVLVRDINPGLASSSPGSFVNLNGTLLFTASDGSTGLELWTSDGTSDGTKLLRDISPSGSSGLPTNLGQPLFLNAIVGSTLYFAGNTITSGAELWKTDGTSSGTVMVADLFSGSLSSAPSDFVNLNGTLYFAATNSTSGRELWTSDGTSTTVVREIGAGASSGSVKNLVNLNGTLLFQAFTPVNGYELWRSDGSSAGTVIVKDIATTGSGKPEYLRAVGGVVYFIAQASPAIGPELWKSDGTSAGTVAVRDISSFNFFSPTNFAHAAELNGIYYFRANGGMTGEELWRTDGTSAGTYMVRELFSGFSSSFPSYLTAHNGLLYFSALDQISGSEIFVSDGTSAGTVVLKDIIPGGGSSRPFVPGTLTVSPAPNLGVYNGQLYFGASDGSGLELWSSDGTSAGTSRVADIVTATAGSSPQEFVALDGKLAFAATDAAVGGELWASNGTSTGTAIVRDISTGSSSPRNIVNAAGRLFFAASTTDIGTELWTSDGTSTGTTLTRDINASFSSAVSTSNPIAATGSSAFFIANDGTLGAELWKSDGTSTGTYLVRDIRSGSSSSSISSYGSTGFAVSDGVLYFFANDGTSGAELWKSDGTSSGTVLVRDIRSGTSTSTFNNTIVALNGLIYFTANDGTNGTELWRSDGTSDGTVMVRDIAAGSGSSSPGSLTVIGNTLYFSAFDTGANGTELWKTDGTSTGTVLVRDIFPTANSFPSQFFNANGTLYFTATSALGTELWKSDGTSTGTVLVRDIYPGSTTPGSLSPTALANIGDVVYFAAATSIAGTQLWHTDGTSAGTTMIPIDLVEPSSPSSLFAIDDRLYFVAYRGDVGRELFTLREVPAVSLTVNGSTVQRSRINTLSVTFDTPLDVTLFQNPGAVTLTRTAGGPMTVVTIGSGLIVAPGTGNSNSITLTFQNLVTSGVENGSLADGRWQLAIPSLNYTSSLNDPALRRLFGDVDSNGTVNADDFAGFGNAFGNASIAFDFDNNLTINADDFAEFGNRFGLTL